MIRLRHKMLIYLTLMLDQLLLFFSALGVMYLRLSIATPYPTLSQTNRLFDAFAVFLLVVGWIWIYFHNIRYRSSRLIGLNNELSCLLKATTLSSVWFLIICTVFFYQNVNPVSILLFWTIITSVGIMIRVGQRWIVLQARKSGYNQRYLLMVGANARSAEVARNIENRPELGYQIIGFVSETDRPQEPLNGVKDEQVIGKLSNIRELLKNERVDEILVCLNDQERLVTFTNLISAARDLGIVLRIVPENPPGALSHKIHIEEFEKQTVITFFREQLILQLFIKRIIDVVIAISLMILLSPLFAIVAILVRATSTGPTFYTQERVGMNQRRFRLYKFRSMVANADDLKNSLSHLNERDGPAFKIANDPRITRVGYYIRKTSIDELPQLYNVLKGEMSLVGPRPPLPSEVRKYQWLYRRRLSVKPGITCSWQISKRSKTSFEEWMKMDNQYIESWSLLLDIKILIKTIPAVILCRDAS